MDYEELYQQIQAREKSVKEKLSVAQKIFKNLSKNTENGDLRSLLKDLASMESLLQEHGNLIHELKELAEGFDVKEYMENGDFAQQMVEYCANSTVDVKGEYPTYEMFPYKIKIDSENQDLYIDGKRMQCARPLHFVNVIKQSMEKLMKASFNGSAFLNELADAYDTVISLKPGNRQGDQDLLLKDLYRYMVPMQRFRREYDMQNFSFDLSRLLSSDVEYTKDGRRYQLGKSKRLNQHIRLLDKNGKEQLFATIIFFAKADQDKE